MQTYKGRKRYVCAATAFALLLAGGMVSADGNTASVFDMRMPSIDFPTMGQGMYTPGAGRSASSSQVPISSGTTAAASSDKAAATVTPSSASTSLLPSLSAADLVSLGKKGLADTLLDPSDMSGYYNVSGATVGYNNLYLSTDTNERTNELLQKILVRLEDIKAEEEKANANMPSEELTEDSPAPSVPAASTQSLAAKTDTAKSHLLRFTVNGYDVLRTCRTVYISDVQQDGTFLVTGDRRYLSDGKPRTETFHMLFKTTADSADQASYDAATAVSQDYFNPNSFMYQLSQRKNLNALRTGNLVTMRTDDPTWKLELLIDLGEEKQ